MFCVSVFSMYFKQNIILSRVQNVLTPWSPSRAALKSVRPISILRLDFRGFCSSRILISRGGLTRDGTHLAWRLIQEGTGSVRFVPVPDFLNMHRFGSVRFGNLNVPVQRGFGPRFSDARPKDVLHARACSSAVCLKACAAQDSLNMR